MALYQVVGKDKDGKDIHGWVVPEDDLNRQKKQKETIARYEKVIARRAEEVDKNKSILVETVHPIPEDIPPVSKPLFKHKKQKEI
jgi:uncharacterized protein YpmB